MADNGDVEIHVIRRGAPKIGRILTVVGLVCAVIGGPLPMVAGADSNPATIDFQQTCLVKPQTTRVSQAGRAGAQIGETIRFGTRVHFDEGTVYQQASARPDGTIDIASFLELTVPASTADVDISSASPELRRDGVVVSFIEGTQPDPVAFVHQAIVAGTSTIHRIYLPGDVSAQLGGGSPAAVPSIQVPPAGLDLELTTNAHLNDTATNAAPQIRTLGACRAGVATGESNRVTNPATATVGVVEPALTLAKSTPASSVTPGTDVTYRLTAAAPAIDPVTLANNGDGHHAVIVDVIPAGLTPLRPSGSLAIDGDDVGDGGLWDASARTITWQLGTLAVGTTRALNYRVRVDTTNPAGTALTNRAELRWDSADTGTVRHYGPASAQRTVTTTALGPTITKQASLDLAGVGQRVDYSIDLDVPNGAVLYNATVFDLLPDGMTLLPGSASASCTSGCVGNEQLTALVPTVLSSGATRLGWALDDPTINGLAAAATSRQFHLTYAATISEQNHLGEAPALGQTFTNLATLNFNQVDRIGPIQPSTALPPAFDAIVGATHTLTHSRPLLQIEKRFNGVTPLDRDPNAVPPTFSILVTNNGGVDAQNVQIEDFGVGTTFGGFASGSASATFNGLAYNRWELVLTNPIPPGATAEIITYLSPHWPDLPSRSSQITNAVHVTRYADPAGNEYTDGPSSTVAIPLTVPNLTIAKAVVSVDGVLGSTTASTTGSIVRYRVTVSNTGDGSAWSPNLRDLLPSGTVVQGVVTPGVTTAVGLVGGRQEVYFYDWLNGQSMLAPGATASVEYEVRTTASNPGTLTNEARVTWTDGVSRSKIDGQLYVATATAQVELRRPTIGVVKVAGSPTITQGQDATFEIRVTNLSPLGVATNLTIEDTLPPTLEWPGYALGTVPAYSISNGGTGTLTIDGGSATAPRFRLDRLMPGETAVITLPVHQSGATPPSTTLTNTVSVSGTGLSPAQASATMGYVSDTPVLTIDKTPDITATTPTPASSVILQNGTGTFTITIANSSPTVTARDLLIADALPPTLAVAPGVVAVFSGLDGGFSDNTTDPSAPQFAIDQLLPGESVTISVPVIHDGTEPALAETDPWLINTATLTARYVDAISTTGALRYLHPKATLAIAKTPDQTDNIDILEGQTSPVAITVTNTSPYYSAENVVIRDFFPSGLENWGFVDGTFAPAGSQDEWYLDGNDRADLRRLEPGQSFTLRFDAIATAPPSGYPSNEWFDNLATAHADNADTVSDHGALHFIANHTAVSIYKGPEVADGVDIPQGGNGTFTITVVNDSGSLFASGMVDITDPMPSTIEYLGGASIISVSGGTNTPTFSDSGSSATVGRFQVEFLEPGQSVTIEVPVRQNGQTPSALPADGFLVNTATASGANFDTVADSGALRYVPNQPVLTVTKTPDGEPAAQILQGGTAQFTVAVTNTSPYFDATNLTLTDVLGDSLNFDGYSAVVTDNNGAVVTRTITPTVTPGTDASWVIDRLAAGETATFTVFVRQDNTVPSSTVLTNTARAWVAGVTPVEDTGSLNLVTGGPDLTITKTPDNGTTLVRGQTVDWTVTVLNNSPTFPARNVSFVDTLPSSLSLESMQSIAFANPGSGTTTQVSAAPPTWVISRLDPGQSVTFVLRTRHDGSLPRPIPTSFTNTAAVTYVDASNSLATRTDTGTVGFDPAIGVLTIAKTPEAATNTPIVQGLEGTTPYTITVANTSTTGELTNVVVNDPLPSTLQVSTITPPSWVVAPANPAPVITNQSAGGLAKFLISRLGPLQSVTFQVWVKQDGSAPAGWPSDPYLTNTATASATLTPEVADSGALRLVSANPQLTLRKTPDVADQAVVIAGGTQRFTISLTNTSAIVPAFNVQIGDALPATLTWADAASPNPAEWLVSGPGTHASIVLSSSTPTAPAWTISQLLPGQTATVYLDVQQDGTTPPTATLTNLATVTADRLVPALSDIGTLTFVENAPTLTVTKTPAVDVSAPIVQGGTGEYQIYVRNDSPYVDALNLRLDDVLPPHLTWNRPNAPSPADWSTSDGIGTVTAAPDSTVARPVLLLDRLNRNQTLAIRMPVVHDGAFPVSGDMSLINQVNVNASNHPGVVSALGELTLQPTVLLPVVSKAASPAAGAPGDLITFAIDVTLPDNGVDTFDTAVVDSLPDGLELIQYVSTTCLSGSCTGPGAPEFGGAAMTPTALSDGSTLLGWYFGDIPTVAVMTQFRMVIEARVDSAFDGTGTPSGGSVVQDGAPGGDPLTNSVQGFANYPVPMGAGDSVSGFLGTVPSDPRTFFGARGQRGFAPVDVLSPRLIVDKTSDAPAGPNGEGGQVEVDAFVNYTVTVTNTGSSSAHRITVRDDTADPTGTGLNALRYVTDTTSGATLTHPWADVDGQRFLEWELATLAPGASATLTYHARTPDSAHLGPKNSGINADTAVAENTVEVVAYHSQAAPSATDVTYSDTTPAVYELMVYTPIPRASAHCFGGSYTFPQGGGPAPLTPGDKRFDASVGNYGNNFNPPVWRVLPLGSQGTGYSAVLTVELSPTLSFKSGSVWAAGPEVGIPLTTQQTYIPYRDPDIVSPDRHTLTWYVGSIDPAIPGPALTLVFDAADSSSGPASQQIRSTVTMTDAAGSTNRGTAVSRSYEYRDSRMNACYSPPPKIGIDKRPDGLVRLPGQTLNFTVTMVIVDGLQPGQTIDPVIVDTLPAGLTYTGGATVIGTGTNPASPSFTETVQAIPLGTQITWQLHGTFTEGGVRITIPVSVDASAVPGSTMVNAAQVSAPIDRQTCHLNGSGCQDAASSPLVDTDTGSVIVKSPATITVAKSVDHLLDVHGGRFEYSVDVTVPANVDFTDALVVDRTGYAITATTPRPMRFAPSDLISAGCVSGCNDVGSGDDIEVVSFAPDTSGTTDQPRLGWLLRSFGNDGAHPDWLLADPEQRVVRLVFATTAPALSDYPASILESADFEDILGDWTDRVEVSTSSDVGGANNVNYSNPSWYSTYLAQRGAGIVAITDHADATVTLLAPSVTVNKICTPIDANPVTNLPVGTEVLISPSAPNAPNVECSLVASNTSSYFAYDAILRDTPEIATVLHDTDTGTQTPGPNAEVDVKSYATPAPDHQYDAADPYVEWQGIDLAPGESMTMSYRARVDVWDGVSFPATSGNAVYATTSNTAEVLGWRAGPDPATNIRFGYAQDTVGIAALSPRLDAGKADRELADAANASDLAIAFDQVQGSLPDVIRNPGDTVPWRLDLAAFDLAAFNHVTVSDTLPPGWRFVDGSARLINADGTETPLTVAPSAPTDTCSTTSVQAGTGPRLDFEFFQNAAGGAGALWRDASAYSLNSAAVDMNDPAATAWNALYRIEFDTTVSTAVEPCLTADLTRFDNQLTVVAQGAAVSANDDSVFTHEFITGPTLRVAHRTREVDESRSVTEGEWIPLDSNTGATTSANNYAAYPNVLPNGDHVGVRTVGERVDFVVEMSIGRLNALDQLAIEDRLPTGWTVDLSSVVLVSAGGLSTPIGAVSTALGALPTTCATSSGAHGNNTGEALRVDFDRNLPGLRTLPWTTPPLATRAVGGAAPDSWDSFFEIHFTAVVGPGVNACVLASPDAYASFTSAVTGASRQAQSSGPQQMANTFTWYPEVMLKPFVEIAKLTSEAEDYEIANGASLGDPFYAGTGRWLPDDHPGYTTVSPPVRREAGDVVDWIVQVAASDLGGFDSFTVVDTLPKGFSIVPGSAVIVDGNGNRIPISAVESVVPHDPSCEAPGYGSNGDGDVVTWAFDQGVAPGAVARTPWDAAPFSTRTPPVDNDPFNDGWRSYLRIEFQTMVDADMHLCDIASGSVPEIYGFDELPSVLIGNRFTNEIAINPVLGGFAMPQSNYVWSVERTLAPRVYIDKTTQHEYEEQGGPNNPAPVYDNTLWSDESPYTETVRVGERTTWIAELSITTPELLNGMVIGEELPYGMHIVGPTYLVGANGARIQLSTPTRVPGDTCDLGVPATPDRYRWVFDPADTNVGLWSLPPIGSYDADPSTWSQSLSYELVFEVEVGPEAIECRGSSYGPTANRIWVMAEYSGNLVADDFLHETQIAPPTFAMALYTKEYESKTVHNLEVPAETLDPEITYVPNTGSPSNSPWGVITRSVGEQVDWVSQILANNLESSSAFTALYELPVGYSYLPNTAVLVTSSGARIPLESILSDSTGPGTCSAGPPGRNKETNAHGQRLAFDFNRMDTLNPISRAPWAYPAYRSSHPFDIDGWDPMHGIPWDQYLRIEFATEVTTQARACLGSDQWDFFAAQASLTSDGEEYFPGEEVAYVPEVMRRPTLEVAKITERLEATQPGQADAPWFAKMDDYNGSEWFDTSDYALGDPVTFVVQVAATNLDAFASFTMSDDLPPGLDFASAEIIAADGSRVAFIPTSVTNPSGCSDHGMVSWSGYRWDYPGLWDPRYQHKPFEEWRVHPDDPQDAANNWWTDYVRIEIHTRLSPAFATCGPTTGPIVNSIDLQAHDGFAWSGSQSQVSLVNVHAPALDIRKIPAPLFDGNAIPDELSDAPEQEVLTGSSGHPYGDASIPLGLNDELDWVIEVSESGLLGQSDYYIEDRLPHGFELVPGSVHIIRPDGSMVALDPGYVVPDNPNNCWDRPRFGWTGGFGWGPLLDAFTDANAWQTRSGGLTGFDRKFRLTYRTRVTASAITCAGLADFQRVDNEVLADMVSVDWNWQPIEWDSVWAWHAVSVVPPHLKVGKYPMEADAGLGSLPVGDGPLSLRDVPLMAGAAAGLGFNWSSVNDATYDTPGAMVYIPHLGGYARLREVGETTNWVVQVASLGLVGFPTLGVRDTLPSGYRYVPGSAVIVTRDAAGTETRYPIEPEMDMSADACSSTPPLPGNNNDGPTLLWQFSRDASGALANFAVPWSGQFTANPSPVRDLGGAAPYTNGQWDRYHRIEYSAVVTDAAFDCLDPGTDAETAIDATTAIVDSFRNTVTAEVSDIAFSVEDWMAWDQEALQRRLPQIGKVDPVRFAAWQDACLAGYAADSGDPDHDPDYDCTVYDRWAALTYPSPDSYRKYPYSVFEPFPLALIWGTDNLTATQSFSIDDVLPHGTRYRPGTAVFVETLPDGTEVRHPLSDPFTISPDSGACEPGPIIDDRHGGGPTLRWDFVASDTGPGGLPWRAAFATNTFYPGAGGTGQTAIGWQLYRYLFRVDYEVEPTAVAQSCITPQQGAQSFSTSASLTTTWTDGTTHTAADWLGTVYLTNALEVSKTPDAGSAPDGSTAEFHISVTNHFPTVDDAPPGGGTANDLQLGLMADWFRRLSIVERPRVSDTITVCGLSDYVPGTAVARASDGSVVGLTEISVVRTDLGGGCQSIALTFELDSIGPTDRHLAIDWFGPELPIDFSGANTVVITVPVEIPNGEVDGTIIDNSVCVEATGEAPAEQCDEGDIEVVNPSPAPPASKSTSPTATINDRLGYEVSVTIPANQTFFDLAYVDRMADGAIFDGFDSATCETASGGDCGFTIFPVTPQVGSDGVTTFGWWLGDVAGMNEPRTLTFNYHGHVGGTYVNASAAVQRGDHLVNTVTGVSNDENRHGNSVATLPAADTFDYRSAPASTDTVVIEPQLALTKTVLNPTTGSVGANDIVSYRITVTNSGDSTAYGIGVQDRPPDALTDVLAVPAPGFELDGWTPGGPDMAWYLPSLDPGASASFEYSATVVANIDEQGIATIDNVATTSTYQARAIDQAGNRTYPGLDALAAVPVQGPRVHVEKWASDGCSASAVELSKSYVNSTTQWCIEVSNAGTADAHNITLKDFAPADYLYVAGTAVDALGVTLPDPSGSGPYVWTVGDLAPGQTWTVRFTTTTPSEDHGSNPVFNYALVEATNSIGMAMPFTATAYRDQDEAATSTAPFGIEIAKTPKVQYAGYVPDGGPVGWDITVTNPSTNELHGVELRDTLPAGLQYVGSDRAPSSVGPTVPGAPTEILWDLGTLAAGASVTIHLDAAVPAGQTAARTWTNDAEAWADEVADGVVDQARLTIYELAALGDRVWLDRDGDGTQDADESGLEGVTVHLLDHTGVERGITLTDIDGYYLFDRLEPGDYSVRFELPPGYSFTQPNLAADDLDSDAAFGGQTPAVTLDAGEVDETLDAGVFLPAAIGDWVWEDRNEDGVQGADEAGWPGVPVALLDSSGAVIATQLTDSMGHYLFTGLAPGNYRVRFTLPDGMYWTDPDLGGDDSADSDADAQGVSASVNLASGETDRSVDAGVHKPHDIALTKTASAEVVEVNQEVTWTMRVTNVGPTTARGPLTVSDPLPEGLEFVRGVGTDWTCGVDANLVTCTYPDSLEPGGSLTVDVVTRVTAVASIINIAEVRGIQTEITLSNNIDQDQIEVPTSSTTTTVPRKPNPPDLAVTGGNIATLLRIALITVGFGWVLGRRRRER